MPVPLRKENETFTYADYLTWPDEERWELIEGIPYDMTPAPARIHQEIVTELLTGLNNKLKAKGKKCKVYPAPFDVRLPEGDQPDEDIQTVVQPDISIICDESKLDDRGCKGAPDLVIEIISPSNSRKDMKIKLNLYEKHRVPEYWIVLPEQKTIMVYRLDSQNRYGRPETYFQDDVVPVKLKTEFEINLEEVF